MKKQAANAHSRNRARGYDPWGATLQLQERRFAMREHMMKQRGLSEEKTA
jgi:hypothetical protein